MAADVYEKRAEDDAFSSRGPHAGGDACGTAAPNRATPPPKQRRKKKGRKAKLHLFNDSTVVFLFERWTLCPGQAGRGLKRILAFCWSSKRLSQIQIRVDGVDVGAQLSRVLTSQHDAAGRRQEVDGRRELIPYFRLDLLADVRFQCPLSFSRLITGRRPTRGRSA